MARARALPKPTAFLDPLTEVDTSLLYAVPEFYSMDSTNTRWFLNAMRCGNVDKIRRKMDLRPDLFHTKYFQILDDPHLYHCRDPKVHSLFHKQAVLYLTSVGMAIYLRSMEILQLLLEYRDQTGDQLYNINDPQYATHVQDLVDGDFHAYPVSLVMIRGGFFEAATQLLGAGWNPCESVCMPMRRRYERRVIFHHDWLDYSLCLMHDKPLLQISKLVHCMISLPEKRKYNYLPMKVLKPELEDKRIATGVIDLEDLPMDARPIGTKSLLDIANDYSFYLQARDRQKLVQDCIKQMVCDGVNPEVMMAAALDCDGYEEPEDGTPKMNPAKDFSFVDSFNENNNATTDKMKTKNATLDTVESEYVSEPTRILLHANQTDAKLTMKAPLRPLLDAVAEYIQCKFYLIYQNIVNEENEKNERHQKSRRIELQKRDAKNAITLLLNLMQLQYDKLDHLGKSLREEKPKFKHVDTFKVAHNKRVSIAETIRRISDMLFKLLLHSGEFLYFVQASFPPYSYGPGGHADFEPNPKLQHRLRTVQLETMFKLSKSKTAAAFLDIEGLEKASKIEELYLNLRLGRPPTQEEIDASVSQRKKPKDVFANANNMPVGASGKGGAVTTMHRLGNNEAYSDHKLLAGSTECCERDVIDQALTTGGGRVTFVKVKRRPRPRDPERSAPAAENSVETGTETEDPETGGELAFRLSEKIAALGRSALGGADVTQKLVEMYQLILGDLSQIPSVREVLNNAPFAGIEEAASPQSDGEALHSELNANAGNEFIEEESRAVRDRDCTGHSTAHQSSRHHFKRNCWGGSRRMARRPVMRIGFRRTRHEAGSMFDAQPGGSELTVSIP